VQTPKKATPAKAKKTPAKASAKKAKATPKKATPKKATPKKATPAKKSNRTPAAKKLAESPESTGPRRSDRKAAKDASLADESLDLGDLIGATNKAIRSSNPPTTAKKSYVASDNEERSVEYHFEEPTRSEATINEQRFAPRGSHYCYAPSLRYTTI